MTALPSTQRMGELPARVEALDALRGLAALSVLIFHARGIFWLGFTETLHRHGLGLNLNAWLGYLTEPFSYGFLGVNLFFVLSGYCIHRRGAQKLAHDPGASLDWMAFARRRFWRIYPTYVAALLLTALVDWYDAGRQTITLADQDNSPFTFLVSLLTLQGYFAPYFGDNAVFWTLAIEVHLYAVYPILFAISRRYGPQRVLLFTLSVALAYIALNQWLGIENRLPYRSVQGPIFLPFWFTWAIGFYVAEIEAGRVRDFADRTWNWLMVVGLVVGLPPNLHGAHPEFADLFLALFFAGFVRWSLKPGGRRFWDGIAGRGLAAVGFVSYSLYAIHNPMLSLFHTIISTSYHAKFETIWPTVAAVVFVLPCAWVFFQLVERWSLRPAKGTHAL